MKFALLLVAAAIAQCQTAHDTHDPNVVLDQARARLQAMAHTLEQYVCIETVNRSYYQRVVPSEAPPRPEGEPACGNTAAGSAAARDPLQLESTDRVRLEVTVSEGRELHSWPGATRFDARDVDELIRDGPVSTGAFGGHLARLFGKPGVTFQYTGERIANGKTVFEYQYRVPLDASHFEIKADSAWHPVAYEGDFQIDPKSLELERLTIRTTELPPVAAFCQAATTLDYQRVHIGDSDVLLPRQSQLEILLKNGKEARNVTTFANCREYQAESEISFNAPTGAETMATRSTGRGRVVLPIGLPVTLALTESIDTATAAAGDPIDAKVVKPVRRAGSTEELIPAGATVHGRIRRVEHHLLPTPYILVAISFNRVDVHGVVSPFVARSDADAALARELGANLAVRETGIWFWGVGTFLFPTSKSHTVMPAGFESKWYTLATGSR
jgi:hypothetical protein